jgi:glutamyl-tRNA reductase
LSTASQLQVWGIDHHRAPTSVREQVHIDADQAARLNKTLAEADGFISCVPVSTCNRTEIYVEVTEDFHGHETILTAFADIGIDGSLFLGEYGLRLRGREAVQHLYRVAAGLESMMLGEPQIMSQLKDAYRLAKESHELGPVIMRAFQGAFRASKCVRTKTRIGEGAVSVAFAAVELARKFFTDLSDVRALLVGAGETGALAARHFLQQGVGGLTVINRSQEKAIDLAADLNDGKGDLVRARAWEDLEDALAQVDVVLSTTGSTEPVILPEMVKSSLDNRKGKPLFILDIAVPRDVHPGVADLGSVYLFGLDDLDEIVQANLASRRKRIPQAETVIEAELGEFQKWISNLDLQPTVEEFRSYMEGIKEKQVGFVRKKQSPEIASAVEESLQQFIKKMLGRSMANLKNAPTQEERVRDLDSLRRLFSAEERDGTN